MTAGLLVDWLLSPWAMAVLGLAIGSFLNVVAYRLPLMLERQWWSEVHGQLGDADSHQRVFKTDAPRELGLAHQWLDKSLQALPRFDLAMPGSRCPSCGHAIRWHENLPLLGWLRLGGRCSACKVRISVRYPLVEVTTGALFAAVAWRHGAQPATLLYAGFAAALVALTLIDWDTTVLPDAITQPLLWAGLAAAALGWLPGLALSTSVWGAVVGYGALWSVYWLFKLTTGKEGMGYGDFKLLGALGAWLGWKAILPIVLMASILGAIVGVLMKVQGSLREGRFVPFGPFLAGGGLVVLLAGLGTVLEWIGWA